MMSPTHVIGGYAITGTFAALAGENIFATKTNIACVLICSLLPDIDLPKSPISWLILPVSRWINKRWGHRTYTHTLWALIIVMAFAYFTGLSVTICGIAFFSHLLLDMMTKSGVMLFYPFSEVIGVIPSNVNLRFTTGEPKTEILVSAAFLAVSIFMYPLTQNGFWTTFNRGFGVPRTIYSEFLKSQDLLNVSYVIQNGSIQDTGTAYLIACEREDYFHLWRNDSFIHIDAQRQIVKSVVPEHSHRRFFFDNHTFMNISVDSLNNLLRGKIVCELNISANEAFIVSENGVYDKKTSAIIRYPNRLSFQSIDSLLQKDTLFSDIDFESQRIQNELTTLQNEHKFRQSEYQRHVDSLNIYESLARSERSELLKERYQKRRDEIHLPDKPVFNWVHEKALNASLTLTKDRFRFEQSRRNFENNKAYNQKTQLQKQTLFVGVLKFVRIE